MPKKAFITGITGQDGSYLSEFLLSKGYEVGGLVRSSSTGYLGNIEHLKGELKIFRGTLEDEHSIELAVNSFEPDEIYNLGAEASPADSFKKRVYTSDVNALGPLRVYEVAIRLQQKLGKKVKVYQASTSEMFGAPPDQPQTEKTIMLPNNPYGASKLMAHNNARILREGKDQMFIACGILFNHESPRRGLQYVTRKVTAGVACIVNKVKNPPLNEAGEPLINNDGKLEMGDYNPKRDWGFSKEYVEGMWMMLQQEKPDDFILATGETHSIQELLEVAFSHVGLDWQDYVVQNPKFMRPLETGPSNAPLWGNPAKAKEILGWEPKTKFTELIKLMVDADKEKFKG